MNAPTPDETPPLWGEDRPDSHRFGEGMTETAVRHAIESLHQKKPLEPSQLALAQICRSLAKNIDAGNAKGRAIANEAQQLATMLDQLQGLNDPEANDEGIPDDVKKLYELGSVPAGNDSTETRDPAQS